MADSKKCKRCGACPDCGASPQIVPYPYPVFPQPWPNTYRPPSYWPYTSPQPYPYTYWHNTYGGGGNYNQAGYVSCGTAR